MTNENEEIVIHDDGICGHVYKTTNLITGQIYVGAVSKEPKYRKWYLGSGRLIKEAINEYGFDNFKKEILMENIIDINILNEFEKLFIEKENSTNDNGNYNIRNDGGDLHIGAELSYESKENQKIKRIGSKRNDITKQRMSIAQRGKKRSLNQCHKNSYRNGNCVMLIPPKTSYIKEIIVDNSLQLTCNWLGLCCKLLKKYQNNEIRPYHIDKESQVNTIGWSFIDNTKEVKDVKNKKYKLYEFITPDGEIFEKYTFRRFCESLGFPRYMVERYRNKKISINDIKRKSKNSYMIGWTFNFYEVDETNKNDIKKYLVG